MILTHHEIAREVDAGRITIDDFDRRRLEPNSYGFRLGKQLLRYDQPVLDARHQVTTTTTEIGSEGYVLRPGRLYLGGTMEGMGSPHYAAELYACRSVATLGVWIQFSAPLGHAGAIFPWTLEMAVVSPVRLFAGMTIGKIAFWSMRGQAGSYVGRYIGSRAAVASRMNLDANHPAAGTDP